MATKLTQRRVNLLPSGRYSAGYFGLQLIVNKSGRYWTWRGVVHGGRLEVSLGPVELMSLDEAMERTIKCTRRVRKGKHPLRRKERTRREARQDQGHTLRNCVDMAVARRKMAAPAEKRYRQVLAAYGGKLLDRPVRKITASEVIRVVEPLWLSKHPTGTMLLRAIRDCFDVAIAIEWTKGNPAEAARRVMPAVKHVVKHRESCGYQGLAGLLATVDSSKANPRTKLLVQFLVLTGVRVGQEARLARWEEIDMESATWTIPGERMKARKDEAFRVPLSRAAINVLAQASDLMGDQGYVFCNRRGEPMGASTVRHLLRRLGIDATAHGMRSALADYLAEQHSDVAVEIAEACLAHDEATAVRRAYRRTDYLEQRRPLMESWGRFVTGGNVLSIRRIA